MYDQELGADDATNQLSRRALIGGLGAAGAAVGLASLTGTHVAHAQATPEAIAPPIAGLSYVGLDAFAFDVAATDPNQQLYYENGVTGSKPLITPDWVYAALPLPAGSVVRQLSISYVGTPIPNIVKRSMGQAGHTDVTPVQTTDIPGPGAKSQTFDVNATIETGATYAVRVFCSAGDSVLGVEVGYVPPPQAFVPFTGDDPRVLDTRLAGNSPFAPDEERTVDLSGTLLATGRAAVLNITATATGGPGFLAVFSDAIAYPGNSSVNFTAAGQTIANSAVCTMAAGKIKVHCGPASSHVVIDVVGTLL
jgi:hypothetical protein